MFFFFYSKAYISQASDEDERPCRVRPRQLGPELLHLVEARGDVHSRHAVFGILLDGLELCRSHKHIQAYNEACAFSHKHSHTTVGKHLRFIPHKSEIFMT